MKMQICIDPIINNFLDRNFQKLLLPIRLCQHIVFSSPFSIEYNCIRPHRITYYIFSLIGTLGFITIHLKPLFTRDYVVNKFIIYFMKLNVLFLVVPFVSLYVLNVILREDHVQLILKIQKSFRLSNFKAYKKSIVRNFCAILSYSLGYAISVAVTRDLTFAVHLYTFIYFDISLTYGISVIALLRDGMDSWISEIEFYSKLSPEFGEEKYNDKLGKLFESYLSLMEAFDMFKRIFKFMALFQPLDTFFHCLLYLQALFEAIKAGETNYGKRPIKKFEHLFCLWVVKNFAFIIIFSLYCERFYMCVSAVDAACSRLLRSLQSTGKTRPTFLPGTNTVTPDCKGLLKESVDFKEAKRLCKNVQRFNRVEFHKMTACEVFTIDGRLTQKFLSLILEYTIVILQFAVVTLILFRTFCTFQRALCYVNFMIYDYSTFDEKGNGPWLITLGQIVFLSKDIVLVILQSIYCEKFYMTVEEAKTACIQLIMNGDFTKSQAHLCKNVIQSSRSFSKMTACGLFNVDATLPMYLLQVICHYVITHLQFYFL